MPTLQKKEMHCRIGERSLTADRGIDREGKTRGKETQCRIVEWMVLMTAANRIIPLNWGSPHRDAYRCLSSLLTNH